MRSLTVDDVTPIYKRNYWDRIKGDALPSGVDFAVFDLAVNGGTGRGAKMLQKVVGVTQDGGIGPQTLGAVSSDGSIGHHRTVRSGARGLLPAPQDLRHLWSGMAPA